MATTGWENQNTRIIEVYVNRVYGQGSEHNTVKELVKELHASGKWMIHGREDIEGKYGFFLSHRDYFDNVDFENHYHFYLDTDATTGLQRPGFSLKVGGRHVGGGADGNTFFDVDEHTAYYYESEWIRHFGALGSEESSPPPAAGLPFGSRRPDASPGDLPLFSSKKKQPPKAAEGPREGGAGAPKSLWGRARGVDLGAAAASLYATVTSPMKSARGGAAGGAAAGGGATGESSSEDLQMDPGSAMGTPRGRGDTRMDEPTGYTPERTRSKPNPDGGRKNLKRRSLKKRKSKKRKSKRRSLKKRKSKRRTNRKKSK